MHGMTKPFVKMTKIGIEIPALFVYNVFIVVSSTRLQAKEGGAFPKGE